MPSSIFMTLIEAELLTTKNSPLDSSEPQDLMDHHPRVALVAAGTPKTSLKSSEPSLHQEVLEESLDSANNSESWTITTPDLSISTSSPRP